jgi:2,4-dichlorophenol 6-monooxygenase
LRGEAGPALLDTYSAERAPIGRQIVDRANRSIGETTRIFEALGLLSADDPAQLQRNMDARKLADPAAEKQRRALREAIEFKNYEFNTHGVELNQRYASSAVLPDGTPMPANPRDDELYHHATTWPGAKLPHAWVGRDRTRLSTLDLGGQGRFLLLTGVGGAAWIQAASTLGVRAAGIGPGADYEDLYGDWARLREIGDSGCLLVRPDNHICFRSEGVPGDPAAVLADALRRVLSR